MRTAALFGVAVLALACTGDPDGSPAASVPSGATSSTPAEESGPETTTTATIVETPKVFEVPRIVLEDIDSPPIVLVEEALLEVDGSCVTAESRDGTFLLVHAVGHLSVVGDELVWGSMYPGLLADRFIASGRRYDLRGVSGEFLDGPFEVPPPEDCEYDEWLLVLGALEAPVGEGLVTRPIDVWLAFPAIGYGPAVIDIDGPCTTIGHPEGRLLVVWPGGTVSLLDGETIHMSRWEGLADQVIRSGDTISLQGYATAREVEDPPPGCDVDGVFVTGRVGPPTNAEAVRLQIEDVIGGQVDRWSVSLIASGPPSSQLGRTYLFSARVTSMVPDEPGPLICLVSTNEYWTVAAAECGEDLDPNDFRVNLHSPCGKFEKVVFYATGLPEDTSSLVVHLSDGRHQQLTVQSGSTVGGWLGDAAIVDLEIPGVDGDQVAEALPLPFAVCS